MLALALTTIVSCNHVVGSRKGKTSKELLWRHGILAILLLICSHLTHLNDLCFGQSLIACIVMLKMQVQFAERLIVTCYLCHILRVGDVLIVLHVGCLHESIEEGDGWFRVVGKLLLHWLWHSIEGLAHVDVLTDDSLGDASSLFLRTVLVLTLSLLDLDDLFEEDGHCLWLSHLLTNLQTEPVLVDLLHRDCCRIGLLQRGHEVVHGIDESLLCLFLLTTDAGILCHTELGNTEQDGDLIVACSNDLLYGVVQTLDERLLQLWVADYSHTVVEHEHEYLDRVDLLAFSASHVPYCLLHIVRSILDAVGENIDSHTQLIAGSLADIFSRCSCLTSIEEEVHGLGVANDVASLLILVEIVTDVARTALEVAFAHLFAQ